MTGHDDLTKKQEIIDSMEATFLQELGRAGANVPPRATVTTALLRGLLWEKREDELLSRGHTTIETQVVKSSRRSALLQLVSQVWKVPKPDYDKVDAMLASWKLNHAEAHSAAHNGEASAFSAHHSVASNNAHGAPHAAPHATLASLINHGAHASGSHASHASHASHGGSNHFSSKRKPSVPSSIGSSAEYDAYEALSALSDAMMVDSPAGTSNAAGMSSPSSASSSSSAANSASVVHSMTREGTMDTQKEPIDSVTAVVFRSSPQLSSIKFNRSRFGSQTHANDSSSLQHQQQQQSFQFPTLVTSSNRFSKRQNANSGVGSPTQSPSSPLSSTPVSEPRFFERANRSSGGYSSPRSLASSPSSSASNDTLAAVVAAAIGGGGGSGGNHVHTHGGNNGGNGGGGNNGGTTTPTSRHKFTLPGDLKSLMNHRGNGDHSNMASPSSVSASSIASDDSTVAPADSIHLASRNSSGARSFPSALKLSSSSVSLQPQHHHHHQAVSPPGTPTNMSTTTSMNMTSITFQTPPVPQSSSNSSNNNLAMEVPISATSPPPSLVGALNPFAIANNTATAAAPPPPSAGPLDPRLLSAALTPPPDHVPVWVPRTNPPVPLVLYPVRGPNGDWFYSYQPISYADMTVLVAGAAAQAHQAHLHSSSPFQPQLSSQHQPQ